MTPARVVSVDLAVQRARDVGVCVLSRSARGIEAELVSLAAPGAPLDPPSGCHFHPRCPLKIDRCARDYPEPAGFGGQRVACWRAGEVPEVFARSGRPGAPVPGPG